MPGVAAGMRTRNLFMLVLRSDSPTSRTSDTSGQSPHVAAQVTNGIGFIGAGGAFSQGYRQGLEDGRRHVVAVAVGVIFPPDAIAASVPLAILILTKPMKRRLFLNRKVNS